MSQATRLTALAEAIGHDVKNLTAKIGDLTALTTTDKSSAVAAINELMTGLIQFAQIINNKTDVVEWEASNEGAGLITGTGGYAPDATATYIKTAASLKQADKLIDTALKQLADRVAQIEGGGTGVQIDDDAGLGDTGVVWSADKSTKAIANANAELKDEILGGAGGAYDTLKELQDLLIAEGDAVAALTVAVNNRVRFDDVQTLTQAQKVQACTNIGIGDPETDLVAAYTAAKA